MMRTIVQTEGGPLAIHGDDDGITQVYFYAPQTEKSGPRRPRPHAIPQGRAAFSAPTPTRIPATLRAAALQLQQYFAGTRRHFDFPIKLDGTPFQRLVWDYLLTIPYGQTRTYGQVAGALGRPKAARAVGGAVGRNPVSIAVPCHRVVPAAGGWGEYGGGRAAKKYLLQLEKGVVEAGQDAGRVRNMI